MPDLTGWLSENPAYILSGLAQGAGENHGLLTAYPGWIDGNAGVTTQALGGLAARDWLHFSVPWWNPYSGVGLPLAAEAQNSALFLPFVLLLRCVDGLTYLKIAMQIVSGLATYALLRELHLSRITTVTGALCFELNGSFAWFAHGPIMPIAFLPLLLFGIERARGYPWQGAFWVGLAIFWSLVAGFPETAYLDGLLGAAWWAVRLATDKKPSLAVAVIGGGLIGLALAAPQLLAFGESLPISFLGNHLDFRMASFKPANLALLLLPYLLGGPVYGGLHLDGAAGLEQYILWYRTAGYLDLAALPLAIAAVQRRDRLRWMLAAWVLLSLGRAAGLAGVSTLVNLVPLVRNTMFHIYILPSVQMALVLLASLGLEDWRRGSLKRVWPAATMVLLLAGLSLPGARQEMAHLRAIPLYPIYPILSVLGAVVAVGMVATLVSGRWTPRMGLLVALVLVGEAAILFGLPLLAGTPTPRGIDQRALAFLRQQPGIVRVVSVASMGPNYSAWFGIAAIDHNYLPVPQNWVDDVRATLQPSMDGINNYVTATDPRAMAAFRDRLPALQAHGVGFLLMQPEGDPFTPSASLPHQQDGNFAVPLHQGAALDGRIPGGVVQQGRVERAAVLIGTYAGTARGTLHLSLCQATRCATGDAPLETAIDNAPLAVKLAPALELQAGEDVAFHISGDGPVPAALWLWPSAHDPVPDLTLRYAALPDAPALAYRDDTVAIFRLQPAPYFDAPGCRLEIRSRQSVRADCAAPSRLLRRELSYPGWRAARNSTPVAVQSEGIFQAVPLPQGVSDWRFDYAPPHVGWAWGASAAGMLALIATALAGLSSGRRAITGRSTNRLIA